MWITCLAGLGLVRAEEGVPLGDVPPGEVLMIIEPHHDDHSWQWGFAGLVSRMIDEGYRGYFVRVSNDEKDGSHGYPHNDMVNLREAQTAVAHLGINDVISLNWRNDYMDPTPIKELRAQLILLIRKLRPDAVMSWDPWGHYDRNPDHRKVARAVAEAVWMAGYANTHPEHLKLGVTPHRVPHVYFTHRGDYGKGHEPNIAIEHDRRHVERKAEGLWAHRNIYFRPEGARAMREELRARRLTVPDLDGLSDAEAIERIEKWYMYWSSARYGRESGVEYAEVFYYLGEWDHLPGLKQYISENAVER